MPRIRPVDAGNSNEQTQQILKSVKTKMGMVPNLISTMAQAPVVAKAYLEFSGAMASGTLSQRVREQISLIVGEANSCGYCVSAHTALGQAIGMSEQETIAARKGDLEDHKENAAIQFAQKVVLERAKVADCDLDQLRQVGYTEGEICEIIANVALNIFTNYFNEIVETEIDFPVAKALERV